MNGGRQLRRTSSGRGAAREAGVLEIALVAATLLALSGLAVGLYALSIPDLLAAGVWLGLAGFAVGLPASAVYHALLRRSLVRAGALPVGWYWRPLTLHARVPRDERPLLLVFCTVGAGGFFAIVAGCAAVALAAWRSV